jgi:4-amino-4-deoxy-L-arabinose transferase-like glycosyltransferase
VEEVIFSGPGATVEKCIRHGVSIFDCNRTDDILDDISSKPPRGTPNEGGWTHASMRPIAWWTNVTAKHQPIMLIVAAWALLVLPLVFLRGFNSDDGVAVTIARTAIEDGSWLTPHMFNVRFVERPTLLSWIIAAISLPFGIPTQLTARLPIILSVLGGALLIFGFLKPRVSLPAAVFGAVLFLACPLVLRYYVTVTADLPLAVVLFAAFVLWWNAAEKHQLTITRWVVIGLVLAVAGLLKGPQPVGYFALGVGTFVLLTRRWAQIPGLILAGVVCATPLIAWYASMYQPGDTGTWAVFMRFNPGGQLSSPLRAAVSLFLHTAPAALIAATLLAVHARPGSLRSDPALIWALTCYALVCTLVVLAWPGGAATRYFFPAVLPICVLGGIGFDVLASRRPAFSASMLIATLTILAYGLVFATVAAPLLPQKFRSAQIDGRQIAEAVRAAPGPIYRTGPTGLNELLYVPARISNVSFKDLPSIKGPGWFALPAAEAAAIMEKRKDLSVALSFGDEMQWQLLRLGP